MGTPELTRERDAVVAAQALPWRRAPAGPPREPFRVASPGGWLRFESGWLSTDQVLKNLETVVSLLQKAMEGLAGIDDLVGDMLGAVNTALLRGDAARPPPPGLERRVRVRLGQINEIVRQCRFHGRGLLDGQCGVVGVGTGVVFVRGGPNTVTSPPDGYEVSLQVLPRRAWLLGGVSLVEDWLWAEQELFLAEGENYVRLRPRRREPVPDFLVRLRTEVQAAGLELEIGLTAQGRLLVRHHQFGSQAKFKGASATTPLLSRRPGKVEWSRKGRDIQGTIGGEPAFGIGRMLIGYLDNPHTSELAVVWRGGRVDEGSGGRVYLVQNGLGFQDRQDLIRPQVRISLPSFHTRQLGRWLDTPSGFASLDELRLGSWQETRDALHLLFAVSCELDDWKTSLGTWIKRYQNQALACLRRGDPREAGLGLDDPAAAERAERMADELRELIRQGRV